MSFDISQLRRADRIIGIGAIAFFIFLFFFKWYGGSASSSIGGISYSTSANGWHTFTNSRWVWLITIIVALALVGMRAAQEHVELPVAPGAIVAGLGGLSTILILYRIIHHPSGGTSGTIAGIHYSASYGIKIGIWLGLIAAVAITYGGYLAMQEEGVSPTGAHAGGGEVPGGGEAPGGGESSSYPAAAAAPPAGTTGGSAAAAQPATPPLPPPAAPPAPPPAGESPPAG